MAVEETIQTVRESPEIEAYRIGLLKSAKELADQGITLPTQQVAGLTGLQQAGLEQAQQGLGAFMPYLSAAGETFGQVMPALEAAKGPVTQEMITGYMSPYQQAVSDEINRAFDMQLNQARGSAVGSGTFGGSRGQIAESEIDRNRAAALAQAQAQNFLQAQSAAERELARRGAFAEGIGQLGLRQAALGETAQALGQRDVEGAFKMGSLAQAQDQALLDAQRQSELGQLYEPYQRLGFLSDIYSKIPTGQQTITQASAPNVTPFQQYLGLGIAGLSAAAGANRAGLFG
tara:strand:+ start:6768 stop:7634 length:867 start_codon:yes stop_codon:yes gene_type:complete